MQSVVPGGGCRVRRGMSFTNPTGEQVGSIHWNDYKDDIIPVDEVSGQWLKLARSCFNIEMWKSLHFKAIHFLPSPFSLSSWLPG
jgi:hypothetical protein